MIQLKMTTAEVVETSFTINNNSPIQVFVHSEDHIQPTYIIIIIIITITKLSNLIGYQLPWFQPLYYYIRNFCNLIGLEQWYFNLIWNTYMWKLQTFCR